MHKSITVLQYIIALLLAVGLGPWARPISVMAAPAQLPAPVIQSTPPEPATGAIHPRHDVTQTAEGLNDGQWQQILSQILQVAYRPTVINPVQGWALPVAEVNYPLAIDPLAQQAYLKASNTGTGDRFGYSVAVDGDTIVVGARTESSNATGVNGDESNNSAGGSGAAYVFVRDGITWVQQAYLKASNTGAGDQFGHAVAIDGDTIVVGAPGEDSNATGVDGDGSSNSSSGSGAAYVFVRNGTTWSQQAYLKASNTKSENSFGTQDQFGYSVAVDGDTIVAGAYQEESDATGVNGDQNNDLSGVSGAAYVFVRDGTTWVQQAYLKASNTGAGDYFGYSVAVNGDTIVVGAPREDSNASGVNGDQSNDLRRNSGAAYVFVRSGTTWSQQAYLKASNPGLDDVFGYSVAVDGDTLVVGMPYEDSNATGVNGDQNNNSAIVSGAAYVFVRDGITWSQQAYLKASNTGSYDRFGHSVAVDGDTVAVGAWMEDSNAIGIDGDGSDNSFTDSGAAYVFVRDGTTWSHDAYLKASNTDAGDYFGHSVAVADDALVAGAYNEDSNATDSGAAYVFHGMSTLASPALSIPNAPIDALNGSFAVPVNFTSNGNSIAAVGFSLDYDETCLSFDAIDGDNDGIPDAISGLPAGFSPSISHDASDSSGELDISLFDSTAPLDALDNGALFTVAFNVIPACITTDGSTTEVTVNFSATPAPSFGDTSGNDVAGTATGATIPLGFNATPTAITLSNSNVDENAAGGTAVGTLSTSDPDAGDTHTYTLVSGDGDTDNASFTIDGDMLKTAAVFDYESKNSYSVRIRTTDDGGLNGTFERSFTISVNDLNEIPTALTLDNSSMDENAAIGTTVGTLSTNDPDAGDTHTYALVSGDSDTDNASFTLDGHTLKTAAVFNFESKNSYSVRIRSSDSGNLFIEQSFVISVNDINDAPVAVDDPNDPTTTVFLGEQATVIDVLANDTDEDGDMLTVTTLTQPANGSATNNSNNVSFTAPDANGSSSFTYQATDGALSSNDATVNVTYVKDDLRGDCNSSGSVSAADFTAIVLEIFDGNDTLHNGNPAWWLIYTGDYAGSPRGCDANASQNGVDHTSGSVTVADIICTVLIFFGNNQCSSNNGVAARIATTATLGMAETITGARGATVTLPLTLDTGGNAVAAASFALTFDAATLHFDASDGDGNGIPDAIAFDVPAGMSISVNHNTVLSRLEVAIFAVNLPMPLLQDGSLATVQLQIAPDATASETPLTLDLVSLANDQGQDVPVTSSDGAVVINGEPAFDHVILLPLVAR